MGAFSAPDQQSHPLASQCSLGRDPGCDLVLQSATASAFHAALRWNQLVWQVKDLGSSNGTWLDGARLIAGRWHEVRQGQFISFGSDEEQWKLTSDGAPALFAVALDGRVVHDHGGMLALPPEDPKVFICAGSDGGWLIERQHEIRPVENRQIVSVDEGRWRVSLPERSASTLKRNTLSLAEITLHLVPSSDEETVSLTIDHPAGEVSPRNRSHHYLLLTLARLRLKDLNEGCSPSDAGWCYVDELAHQLRMTHNQLNVQVFRARKQLAKIGVVDAAMVVERRPGTLQIRLGAVRVDIC